MAFAICVFLSPIGVFAENVSPDSLRNVADSLHLLSDSLIDSRQYSQAIEVLRREGSLRQRISDPLGKSKAINGIGRAFNGLGEFDSALVYADQVLAMAYTSQAKAEIAQAHHTKGYAFDRMVRYNEAISEYQSAVDIRLAIADSIGAAKSLNNLGMCYSHIGNYQMALIQSEKALEIWLEILGPDHPNVATSYCNLGYIYTELADYQQALKHQNKALEIREKMLGDVHPDVATSFHSIGNFYSYLGEYPVALENYRRALGIWLKTLGPEDPNVAMCYSSIGLDYSYLGEDQLALENHQRALAIWLECLGPEHPDLATAYAGLGMVYHNLGAYQLAFENHRKALGINLKAFGPDHPNVAASYGNIGAVYSELGEHRLALENYKKSLEINLKVFGPEHPYSAWSYYRLGLVYSDLEEYKNALGNHEKALGIWLKVVGPEHSWVAEGYHGIGRVHSASGEYQLALENYDKALAICLEALGPENPDVAAIYEGIGEVYRELGEGDSALGYFQKSISIFEKSRSKIKSEELRTAYTETVSERYEAIISLLMEMGRQEEAFEYLERSKSKALKDALDERYDIDFGKGTMREKIEESKRLGMKVDALESQLLEEKQKPDSLRNELKVENLSKLLAETKEEYNRIAVQIQADPDYAFAVKVEPVQLGTMREDIPSGQKLLMTYAGENELYLFLLSQEGYVVRSVSISRDSLNNLITECYRLCGSRDAKRLYNEGKLMGWSWIDDGSDFYNEEVAPLKGMLNELYTYLIEPLEEELSSAKVVTIIPSGNLYYVPWGALLDAEGDSLIFLSERYNWNILTSTELWKCIQRREGKRKRLRSLVLVGNPAGSDPPLEYAEGEVTSIEQFYPNSTILTGIEATEPQVISVAPQGQALHLATHCNLDTESPWESYIQLARTDLTDGKWTVSEVSGQSWDKMQLVTLSACQTALGGERPGLEFISMATAFSLAMEGPPSIVATLWKVHDESTKELMVTFYEELKNHPKSEALRHAQQKLIHSGKYAHPFFWAPFILIGEWR